MSEKLTSPKACHLTTVHDPLDDRIFHKECKSLRAAGYETAIIAPHAIDETVDGIRIVGVEKARNRRSRIFLLPFRVFLEAIRQRADIYHFHDPELIPAGIALRVFLGHKVVYDVHEDYGKQILSKPYLPEISRRAIAMFIRALEYLSSLCFSGIVAATDDILKNFSHHRKAISVKNYPVISHFQGKKADSQDKGTFRVVYVGDVSKTRGIVEAIRALEYIERPIKLVICGHLDPHDDVLGLDQLKGLNKVEPLGWINHERIGEIMKTCNAGIVCLHPLPNYVTALPVKLFEYLAAGLPVIASNFPILREIVEGNRCGFCVNPLEPREIAAALEYLMDHSEDREEMGINGMRAVARRYNWSAEERKLLDLYEVILNR